MKKINCGLSLFFNKRLLEGQVRFLSESSSLSNRTKKIVNQRFFFKKTQIFVIKCDHSATRNFRVEFVHEKAFRDRGFGLTLRLVLKNKII